MIYFKKINEDNFDVVIGLKVAEGQEQYVASNVKSLAQAYLYYENHDVYPFAIYNDEIVVGFMMLDEDLEDASMNIWRIMIGEEYQNKGYGREALELIIQLIKDSHKYQTITIDYVVGNNQAQHLYSDFCFKECGSQLDGKEIVMKMTI